MASNRRGSDDKNGPNADVFPPLDELTKQVMTKQGRPKTVPALHIGFAEVRIFVPYKAPPSWATVDSGVSDGKDLPSAQIKAKEFANAALEEWCEQVTYIIDDLQWLLKLTHYRFWSQVAFDDTLHKCIHSYLSNAPRHYDMKNLLTLQERMSTLLEKLHQLVFFVYLRMSTYKESKISHISPPVFAKLIYDQFLFDVPNLMDLCILYGRENRALLQKMIDNIFSIQPCYFDDLKENVLAMFPLLDSIEEKLGLKAKSKMDNLFQLKSPNAKEEKPKLALKSLQDIQEVIMSLVDLTLTISAFIDIYSAACDTFHSLNFEVRLAIFYETVFEVLEDALLEKQKETRSYEVAAKLLKRVKLAKSAILRTFRDILLYSCLQPILDSNAENYKAQLYVENFLQILMTCLSEKSFICDYENNFPFQDDLDLLSQTQCETDETRTRFIQNSIISLMGMEKLNNPSLLAQTSDTNHLDKFLQGQDTYDCSQLEGATAGPGKNNIELESLICNILDILPNLGRGFIQSCLEYYYYDHEKVIGALLEESLPSCLSGLDRNLATYQPSVRPKEPTSFAKNKPSFSGLLSERKNVFDGDEFDVFNNDEVDRSKVHKGKKRDDHRNVSSLLDDKRDVEAVKDTYKKYEVTVSERIETADDNLFMYDDEYDDTYDDTTTTAWADAPMPGDDLALGRKFTIPRVLRTKEDYEEEEESEDEISPNPNQIVNGKTDMGAASSQASASRSDSNASSSRTQYDPRAEPTQQSLSGANNFYKSKEFRPKKEFKDVKGKAKGQGQDDKTLHARKSKEQHKGAYGNHNRKAQSDRKRSRGMIPT